MLNTAPCDDERHEFSFELHTSYMVIYVKKTYLFKTVCKDDVMILIL